MFDAILLRSCRAALLALALALSPAAMAQLVDNGCPDQNGVQQPNCSKLGRGERITVKATECGYSTTCPTSSAEICRSVINDGNLDYFVPWRTEQEWGAFLSQLTPMTPLNPGATPLPANNLAVSNLPNVSVGACCSPLAVPDVCPGYPCEVGMIGYPGNCSSVAAHGLPGQLGNRRVGTRAGGESNYGAQGDIYGPIISADFFGDSAINYEVAYVCHNGAWIKSYEQGSCAPLDGACNPTLPEPLPNGWTLPPNLNDLCAPGSTIAGPPVDTGTRYDWVCNGTPGRDPAACSRNKFVAPTAYNGTCGPAHNGRLPTAPVTNADKCNTGDVGPLSGLGTDASPWVWTCNGGNGGSSKSCKAYLAGTPLAGICGSANGYIATNVSWMPTQGQMCTRTFTPAVPVATGSILNWTCFGESGGADAACSATLKVVSGACGVPNTYVVTTPPHSPPIAADLPPGACATGTPANITYNSVTQTLSWDCVGANGGSTTNCSAGVDTSLIKGICKWPNGTVLTSIPPATSPALCASGTADNVVTTGALPTVGITWNCLGNQPGYDASCSVSVHIATNGECGSANGMELAAKPSGAALCNIGTASTVTGGVNGPVWGWTCGGIWGGLTAYCGAVYDSTPGGGPVPVNGACNPAKLVPQSSAPSAPLCDAGAPTAVTGGGPWTWQCNGINSGTNAVCTAPLLGAGACGSTHGTRIPNSPNQNLCATGTAGTVTGDTVNGWNWVCTGTSGSTANCHADPCDVCNGDLTMVGRSDVIADQTINYGSGTCQIKGTVAWNVVDRLVAANSAFNVAMAESGSGLAYAKSQLPPAAPANYCTPCYRYPKTITGAFFEVERKMPGACSTGTSLDTAGTKVTITPSSVTITP